MLFRSLRPQGEGPWICCGDFNEALHQDEHLGARDRSDTQMALFRDCLNECGLVDLGFTGPKYTWTNRQSGDDHVKVRLDRAVANDAFQDLFAECQVENAITTTSDHLAISISLEDAPTSIVKPQVQHGFRFEAAWLRAPEYEELMEKSWTERSDGAGSLHSTWSTLHQVATSLKKWGRETFGAVRTKITKVERKIKSLRLGSADGTEVEVRLMERELCELFEREEIMARQRSRIDWLKEGDRNTAFFHAKASARKRTNKIKALTRDDGSRCEDIEGIKGMVHSFYEDLFSSEPTSLIDAVLGSIPCKVSDDMNADLSHEYTDDEIKEADRKSTRLNSSHPV